MTTPATDWRETVPEGEPARLEALAEKLRELQRKRAQKNGKPGRALHFKAHTGVSATLRVNEGLAPHLAQGLFAEPTAYRAYVRFSNGAGHWQPDRTGDVRGIAIKVLGVEGKKIIPGLEDAKTQDFLLIQSPSTPFRDADEFVSLVVAASGSPLLLLPRFASSVGWGRAFRLVRALLAGMNEPFHSFAGRPMYGAVPTRFGPYAVRTALLPAGEVSTEIVSTGKNLLADDLAARLKNGPLSWDLAVQFFVDETKTPIEDASVEWKESDSPYIPVARLEIPQQDVASDEGKALAERIEAMSFDPWHALEAHRPLGNVMRARNHAYRLSTQARGAAPEPD